MSNLSNAITGTDNLGILGNVAIDALKRQAGYIPPTAPNVDAPDEKLHILDPLRCNDDLVRIWQWVGNRGVIAGSTGAWLAGVGHDRWFPRDVDVFTFTEADFDSLISQSVEAHHMNNGRRAVELSPFWDCDLDGDLDITRYYSDDWLVINVIPPRDNAESAYRLLSGFDWNFTAYALLPNGALVAHPDAQRDFTGQGAYLYDIKPLSTKSPTSAIRRLVHYVRDYGVWWLDEFFLYGCIGKNENYRAALRLALEVTEGVPVPPKVRGLMDVMQCTIDDNWGSDSYNEEDFEDYY